MSNDLPPDDLPQDDVPELHGDDALAADYALGVLGRDERRAAELRLASDPAFRTLVEGWQADLAPLNDSIAAVAPSPALWDRIAAELDPAPKPVAKAVAKPSLWASLALWRSLALGSAATAAVALALLLAQPTQPPMLVATLASTDGAALITAAYDPGRRAVILTPAGAGPDATHSPELWVIDGDAPPRSLGVIDMHGPQARIIPAERLRGLRAGAVLAISVEPLGGSPTGLPTGPVVATGKLAQI